MATQGGTNQQMPSIVWAVPATAVRLRETHIFRFLKDARCSVRTVEVRLFKTSRMSDRAPIDRRRWGPGSDLPMTAKEISQYIADSDSAEATIVASDEA
jgi:hypothetical protein